MNSLFDYRQELDALQFTEAQKSALARQAVEAAGKASAPRRRRTALRSGLMAVCLMLALAVGAGASGVLKTVVESFSGIFGGGKAQTEIIDSIGRPIGACDTDNGVTITADAIMGDRYNAAVVFTIRRDDGTALLPADTDPDSLLMGGFGGADLNVLGGLHGGSWFVDEVPGDDAIQMVQVLSADVPLTRCSATAEFEDLCWFDESVGQPVVLIEGHWKFRFDVNYEDTSVSLGGGETFQQGGMTFTVDGISISPVAVKVDYTVNREVQWSDSGSGQQSEHDRRQLERYMENVEILLTTKDGTVLDLSNSGGSIKPENGMTKCSKSLVFEEIIPLEEISSLSVGGIVYPMA